MGESEQKSKHLNQHERERGRGDGRQHDTYHSLIKVKVNVNVRRKHFRRDFALQIYFGLGVNPTDFRRNAKKQAKTQKFNDGIKLYSQRWLRLFEQFSPIFKWKLGQVEDAELSTTAGVLNEKSMNARRNG